ncbi:MAG: Gfo/Idh/MocA family oxidoreductase [Tannerellaceae bacterium]|jgi:predicted dehydrogenase|nr:Gfo/Idh/MocA family oxidoreductase [Tannerellaceae bacterium]
MATRRNFLKTSATALAAGLIAPSSAWGKERPVAGTAGANDKIRVGLIGCRNMGWGDLNDFLLHKDVECMALCDIDRNVLDGRAAELEKIQGRKALLFSDYRKMLELKELDAVIIGTPDHWHCLQFVDACSAGKDIYVEKPVANYIAECDSMVKAAKRYNRVTTVGQQQRSGNHWKAMVEYLKSGKLGTIARADVWANFNYGALGKPVPDSPVPAGVDYDAWQGPAQTRPFNEQHFHGSWRMFWAYGGGLMTDWGVHLLDMVLWGMDIKGMPKRVTAFGGKFAFPGNSPETFDTQNVIYEFDSFIMNWSHTGGVETGPYNRNYGIAFKGTNGTLVADRDNWEIIPEWDPANKRNRLLESIKVQADYQDHKDHVSDFLNCMKTRSVNTACTIENGSLCAKYTHLGNIAARTRSVLVYDDSSKKFTGSEEGADAYLTPSYRSPWKYPSI